MMFDLDTITITITPKAFDKRPEYYRRLCFAGVEVFIRKDAEMPRRPGKRKKKRI
jgi:hypothetical protein